MPEAQILVARQGEILQVRVVGRASFKVSRDLREYGISTLNAGITCMIIDFSCCQGMDSTFMGILAMLGLAAKNKAEVYIVNAGKMHRRLLDGIGISRLFTFAETEVAEVNWQTLCQAAENMTEMKQVAGTILDAHRTLMCIDPENIPKFKDVVELLSAEMHSKKPLVQSKAAEEEKDKEKEKE